MGNQIDIIIADKNPLVLAGLKHIFLEDNRFRVRATASDGERFLEAINRMDVHVGIIGWGMPYLDGRGVLEAMRARNLNLPIIVYTGSLDPDVPRQVMANGGAGFCSKREAPEKILDIVAAVFDGKMIFPKIDVRSLYENPFETLTPREHELLAALAEGLTNAQIAKKTNISINTVKFHLKNLYEKLNTKNRAQTVAKYISMRQGGEIYNG